MKILITLVLGLFGLVISAPNCNYITIDIKYVCLMNSSTATSTDSIQGTHESGKFPTDVNRVTTLDTANKDLIKKVLETFPSLEIFQIQKGGISAIDSTDFVADKCAKLKQLQILNGDITAIGSANENIFASCSLLEEIDLTANKLQKLEIGTLPANLKKLFLDNNRLNLTGSVSTLFGSTYLQYLTHLSVSGNGVSSTNFDVPSANLIHLDFSNNLLTSFPTAVLPKNPKLQYLYLHRNNLTAVTDTFVNLLTDLRELRLGSNLITSIHQDAFKLNTKLTLLDISVNPIKTLNENLLKTLTTLTSLDIHDTQLESTSWTALKTTLEALVKLQKLDISGNLVGAIDTIFSKNVDLMDLNISGMKLTAFTNEIFSTLTKLQNLTFSSNEIAELPEKLFEKTTEMKRLVAKGNKVVTLKASTFASMKNLEVLDFSNNQINKIEKTFFDQFTSLKEVRFGTNLCISEDFVSFNKNDNATMAKFQKCFDNYNSARAIVISNVLLVLVAVVLKFM